MLQYFVIEEFWPLYKSSLKFLGLCFSNKVFGRLQNPVAFFHLLMLLVLLKHTVNLTFFRKAEGFHGDQQ